MQRIVITPVVRPETQAAFINAKVATVAPRFFKTEKDAVEAERFSSDLAVAAGIIFG